MLSYRHAFHAGNFADVFKHLVLSLLLQALQRKDKPFCYVETHAGAGRYDLRSERAGTTAEYREGIARLWEAAEVPAAAAPYLQLVRALNRDGRLRWYPGSPLIAAHWLRPGDRLLLSELHPEDCERLRHQFAGNPQVSVEQCDGYCALEAALPPRERRGLVLIDPAFERKGELERLFDALQEALRRWATGIYAAWYPIDKRLPLEDFLGRVQCSGIRKVLLADLRIYPQDNPLGLNGSGLLIVNPPWRLDQQLNDLLPWLWRTLAPAGAGGWRCEWLVPE